jgi:hypothetical protein
LYWDAAHKAIAFSFASTIRIKQQDCGLYAKVSAVDGYTVAFVGGGAGYIVASGFFKAIGIDPQEHAGQYRYKVTSANDAGIADAGDEIFVLELSY